MRPLRRPGPRPARVLLANLHTTSRPAIVVPWLLAQCLTRRVDAVLLQECTDRHARLLRRLPRWELVRDGDEAILGRRRHMSDAYVLNDLTATWRGRRTGRDHASRTIPVALLRGWLRVADIHFPPGWEDGPEDRQKAGGEYLEALEYLADRHYGYDSILLGGDWNALRTSKTLRAWWKHASLTAHGRGIDYAVTNAGVWVSSWRRIGRAPGMDHNAVLYVARPYPRKATP